LTMITKYGSQSREPLAESGYRLVKAWPDVSRGFVVLQTQDGLQELWKRNNHHVGYTIDIHGMGYEFVRDVKPGERP